MFLVKLLYLLFALFICLVAALYAVGLVFRVDKIETDTIFEVDFLFPGNSLRFEDDRCEYEPFRYDHFICTAYKNLPDIVGYVVYSGRGNTIRSTTFHFRNNTLTYGDLASHWGSSRIRRFYLRNDSMYYHFSWCYPNTISARSRNMRRNNLYNAPIQSLYLGSGFLKRGYTATLECFNQ